MTLVHTSPHRHGAARHPVLDALVGAFAVAVVAFVSALFAHLFREGIFATSLRPLR